jgi:phage N-6-adenine-methyltransferase
MQDCMYSSNTDLWETPQALFDAINREFALDLDVCAIAENAKCKRFFSPSENGLACEWTGRVWMNPPYGREIGQWMRKAFESRNTADIVVCLVPARVDTAWWHEYAAKGEVRFLRGRVRFGDAKNGAPFPSAIVIFRREWWLQ